MQTEQIKIVRPERSSSRRPIDTIDARRTEEMVIAFSGPVGSGPSTAAKATTDILTRYNYDINYIKVSDLIKRVIRLTDNNTHLPENNQYERIKLLQDKGNEFRKKYKNDVLALLVVHEISQYRHRESIALNGSETEQIETARKSTRVAHIIDSLKHPDEWKLLKAVYRDMFYLIGVLCPEITRRKRLVTNKSLTIEDATAIIERDKNEESEYGQKLLKTLQHADFFVRNTSNKVENINKPIERFIKLIFGNSKISPTLDEYAMYIAHSAALRSGCVSRQVGAAIFSNKGMLLATGRNDAPKPGGGLYSEDDGDRDSRCLHLYGNNCKNKEQKKRIFDEIKSILSTSIGDSKKVETIHNKICNIDQLKTITEYSRAVHAEMDAIISCARKGCGLLEDASLYCTTFPCHNCAKHIVAAGITRVYYIEPYEKSLAFTLHEDAVEPEPEAGTTSYKCKFLNFEGVAPSQYINLFSFSDREGVDVGYIAPNNALPILAQHLDTFIEYESKITAFLTELELTEV